MSTASTRGAITSATRAAATGPPPRLARQRPRLTQGPCPTRQPLRHTASDAAFAGHPAQQADNIDDLVAYLLSIDDDTSTVAIPPHFCGVA